MFEGFKTQKLELLKSFNYALSISREVGDQDVEAGIGKITELQI